MDSRPWRCDVILLCTRTARSCTIWSLFCGRCTFYGPLSTPTSTVCHPEKAFRISSTSSPFQDKPQLVRDIRLFRCSSAKSTVLLDSTLNVVCLSVRRPYRRGSCQLVANLLATSRCNWIWETTSHNRHNGLLPAPTCYRLKTCPHCRRKVRLSPLSRFFLRQSHFSGLIYTSLFIRNTDSNKQR